MLPSARKKFPAGPSEGLKRWSLGPLNNSPLEYFTKVAREYGDVAGLRVLNFKTIFINHPDLIEGVLVTNARKYSKGRVLRANRQWAQIKKILSPISADRRAWGQAAGALLSMLPGPRDKDGSKMPARQLRDKTITFFLAAHKTTPTPFSWTWWLLPKNPAVEK